MMHKKKAGFSLVEVLIALAVLSIGVIAAFQLFPLALTYIRVAQERSIASELAGSRMGELRAIGGRHVQYNWDAGLFAGFNDLSQANKIYSVYSNYTTTVQRLMGASEVYLQRVAFTVNLQDGRQERFVTYIAEP